MKRFLSFLIVFMPWCIKRMLLNKIYGYKIAKSAHIGLSYIFPKYLEMADGATIGSLNVAINLDSIVIGKNSSIARNNWITGYPSKTGSVHFSHDKNRKSELIIGNEVGITKNHHIDCTNSIKIGDFVTIAGYGSQFLTHSIDIYKGRQDSHPIVIGKYCFVSTGVKVLGGSQLPAYSVLAAGAVLTKNFNDEWTIYGGVPAKEIKHIPTDAIYFSRKKGFTY